MTGSFSRLLVAGVAVLTGFGSARATDTLVTGTKLSISDPAAKPDRRSLAFTAKDATVSITGVDPTATGANVTVSNGHAGVAQSVTYQMPATGWITIGTPVKGYK